MKVHHNEINGGLAYEQILYENYGSGTRLGYKKKYLMISSYLELKAHLKFDMDEKERQCRIEVHSNSRIQFKLCYASLSK